MGKVIAVDFDGTLCENKYPEIGNPRLDVIDALKVRQVSGDKLILNTCREGELLNNAMEWCYTYHNLHFDSVNANLQERIEQYGGDCRKISADEYWDDKNVLIQMIQSPTMAKDKPDKVNHPSHYTAGGVECIDALEAATTGLNGIEAVCTANAIKYLWRWKKKNGIEDLEKSKWYIDRLIKAVK